MSARVGVVLSGCGVFDGSEIHEAVSILVALDKRGAQIICMAPDISFEVTSHLSKIPANQKRSILEESARIARGKIHDIAAIRAEDLDALVFPGGAGVTRNLSSFATDGPQCKVNTHVERLITDMARARKPIGLACLGPLLAARVLGKLGLKPRLTMGTDKTTADAIHAMHAEHCNTGPADICIDEANRLVTTPCYMNNVGPWVVFQGTDRMVEEVLRMAQAR